MPSFSIAATRTFTAVANGQYVFVTPSNGFIGFATYAPANGTAVVRELQQNQLHTFGSLKAGDMVTVTIFEGSAAIETDGIAADIKQQLMIPSPWGGHNATTFALNTTAFALTAAAHKAALMFFAPKSGVIEEVGVSFAGVTTGDTVDFRLETVGADNNPTGTLVDAGANVNVAVVGGDANTWKTATLGTPPSVVEGTLYAFVVANGAGGGNMSFRSGHGNIVLQQFPCGAVFTAAWAKEWAPCFGVRYRGDTEWARLPGVLPITNAGLATFNDTSNPDERGVRVVMPCGARIRGVWVYGSHTLSSSDAEVRLYVGASSTTVVATAPSEGDGRRNNNQSGRTLHMFASPVFVAAGEVIRATVKATTANNLSISFLDVPNAAVHGALDMGTDFIYTNRNNDGAWTDVSATRMYMGLIVDQINTNV